MLWMSKPCLTSKHFLQCASPLDPPSHPVAGGMECPSEINVETRYFLYCFKIFSSGASCGKRASMRACSWYSMNVQMQRVPVNACINIMLSYTKVYMQRVYMNVCINRLNSIAHGWHVRQSVQPITSKKLESSRVRHHVASRPCEPATDICWRALWLWPWSWNFVWQKRNKQ